MRVVGVAMNACDPRQFFNIQFTCHPFHSFADNFAQACLSLFLVLAKLFEIFILNTDGHVNQVVFGWLSVDGIKNPVGLAVGKPFAILTEQRSRSWTFTLKVFLTFRDIASSATGAAASA